MSITRLKESEGQVEVRGRLPMSDAPLTGAFQAL
jgi:hypothetical protein